MPERSMPTGSYREAAEFQSGIRALDAAVVAVDAGHFAASVSTLVLDDVAVEIVRARPLLLVGAAAERRSGCLLVLDCVGDGTRWNGEPVDAHDAAVLAPGSCLSPAFQVPWVGAFVSIDAEGGGAAFLPLGDDAAPGRRRPVRIRRSDARAHGGLATLLRDAEAISGAPDVLRWEEARWSLRASLRDLLEPAKRPRRRSASGRQRIVRRADEYQRPAAAHPGRENGGRCRPATLWPERSDQ